MTNRNLVARRGVLALALTPLVAALAGTAPRAQAQVPARTQASAAGSAWPEPYEVADIVVEESGARSGVVAKDQAWIDALRRAWVRLKLDLRQPAVQASDRELLDMVASVIVGEEQTGPRSYRGRLTVRFEPRRVLEISGLAPLQDEAPADATADPAMTAGEEEPEITLSPAEPAEPPPAYLGPRYRGPVGTEPGQGRLPEWTRW